MFGGTSRQVKSYLALQNCLPETHKYRESLLWQSGVGARGWDMYTTRSTGYQSRAMWQGKESVVSSALILFTSVCPRQLGTLPPCFPNGQHMYPVSFTLYRNLFICLCLPLCVLEAQALALCLTHLYIPVPSREPDLCRHLIHIWWRNRRMTPSV